MDGGFARWPSVLPFFDSNLNFHVESMGSRRDKSMEASVRLLSNGKRGLHELVLFSPGDR